MAHVCNKCVLQSYTGNITYCRAKDGYLVKWTNAIRAGVQVLVDNNIGPSVIRHWVGATKAKVVADNGKYICNDICLCREYANIKLSINF